MLVRTHASCRHKAIWNQWISGRTAASRDSTGRSNMARRQRPKHARVCHWWRAKLLGERSESRQSGRASPDTTQREVVRRGENARARCGLPWNARGQSHARAMWTSCISPCSTRQDMHSASHCHCWSSSLTHSIGRAMPQLVWEVYSLNTRRRAFGRFEAGPARITGTCMQACMYCKSHSSH